MFLPRSRPMLPPLPAAVELRAVDAGRTWRIGPEWRTGPDAGADGVVSARAADLLLALWERADPLRDPERFTIVGDRTAPAALFAAPIHPW